MTIMLIGVKINNEIINVSSICNSFLKLKKNSATKLPDISNEYICNHALLMLF